MSPKALIKSIIHLTGIPQFVYGVPNVEISVQEYLGKYFRSYSPPLIPIHSAHVIEEPLPINLKENSVSWKFKSLTKRITPTTFTIILQKGKVIGTKGAVVTKENVILSDLSREYSQQPHSLMKQLHLRKKKIIDGNVAVLVTAGSNVYYHWLFDILPRIHLLKEVGVFEDIDFFILPPLSKPFQKESIKRAGISEDKILYCSQFHFHIEASQLFVPSLPSVLGTVNKWSCNYLRSIFSSNMQKDPNSPKKIYISRKDAGIRRIVNEEKLLEELKRRGYEVITNSKLSLQEQVKLFYNATHVIGPHGGGLSNIVFCDKGAKIMDIFSPSFVIPCFWILSNQIGLKYHYYISGEELNPDQPYWINKDTDIELTDDFFAAFANFDK